MGREGWEASVRGFCLIKGGTVGVCQHPSRLCFTRHEEEEGSWVWVALGSAGILLHASPFSSTSIQVCSGAKGLCHHPTPSVDLPWGEGWLRVSYLGAGPIWGGGALLASLYQGGSSHVRTNLIFTSLIKQQLWKTWCWRGIVWNSLLIMDWEEDFQGGFEKKSGMWIQL